MVEVLKRQIDAITDELNTVRGELITIKQAHASLHQETADARGTVTNQADRLEKVEQQLRSMGDEVRSPTPASTKKSLIEAKQVDVAQFSGTLTDDRSKFLAWTERVKDRANLYNENMEEAMNKVAHRLEPVTKELTLELGLSPHDSAQLQGFLKDRTSGCANAIVRDNKGALGLESYRLLCRQYNPMTLQGTMTAQHYELKPKGAKSMSDLPARILD